jgi:hypothetical protein
MSELYRKVVIESESDFPKEKGIYIINYVVDDTQEIKVTQVVFDPAMETSKEFWKEFVFWYLQPIELPTEEDIKNAAIDYVDDMNLNEFTKQLVKKAYIAGAGDMKDNNIFISPKGDGENLIEYPKYNT